jgi:DNA replication protein DnaC
MSENNRRLDEHLKYLKLPFIREHYQTLAAQAAEKQLLHIDYLEKLADGEADLRRDRAIQRRIRQARFPVIKTLVSMIGAIEPPRDRRNEATCGSPKSSHPVIAEMRPPDDHRNKAS